jgi:hypothetical protein
MKKTDLYKNLARKVEGKLKQVGTPDRFAQGLTPDRKDRRKLDQAKGLVPFAIKINQQLADELRAMAIAQEMDINDMMEQLLRKALAVK